MNAAEPGFRHKCPDDVNPKFAVADDGVVSSRREAFHAHVRKVYPYPAEVEWSPLMEASADEQRLGLPGRPTGRLMAVVVCPDCGAEVVVTREA